MDFGPIQSFQTEMEGLSWQAGHLLFKLKQF